VLSKKNNAQESFEVEQQTIENNKKTITISNKIEISKQASFCRKCGNRRVKDGRFCNVCGSKIDWE
jgi:hypothetical protein